MQRSTRFLYFFGVGLLLGLLQTGLLLQLSFTLSAGFGTYLLVTLCWLGGSAIGVLRAQHLRLSLNHHLLIALVCYLACSVALILMPFETRITPLYGVLTLAVGVYPGVFFARQSRAARASLLFFHENNGFIAGLIVGTVGYALWGRLFAWGAPLLVAAFIGFIFQRTQAAIELLSEAKRRW
jgi:hypothetical protein